VLLEHRQIAQRTIDREVDAVVDLLEVSVLFHRAQQTRHLVDHADREAPREHHRDTSSSLPDVAAGMGAAGLGCVLGELCVRRVPANQTISPSERLTIMGFAYTCWGSRSTQRPSSHTQRRPRQIHCPSIHAGRSKSVGG
jgi:hypothetical protein